jgi:predicted DsbA family dithiol-disulfide isomerase
MSSGRGMDKRCGRRAAAARRLHVPVAAATLSGCRREVRRLTGGPLVVFADYVCPYCYLAESVLRRLRAEGTAVEPAAFELRPSGTPLPASDEAWLRHAWERSVLPLAEELGVTLRYPALAARTRKAHEAVAFARAAGDPTAMHEAVYRAYWQEGRDIGRIDVLVDIGAAAGLDRGALRVALDIDQWTDRVAQDSGLARRIGIGGVPAYLLGGTRDAAAGAVVEARRLRVGLQRYDELRSWVTDDDIRADDGGAGEGSAAPGGGSADGTPADPEGGG